MLVSNKIKYIVLPSKDVAFVNNDINPHKVPPPSYNPIKICDITNTIDTYRSTTDSRKFIRTSYFQYATKESKVKSGIFFLDIFFHT